MSNTDGNEPCETNQSLGSEPDEGLGIPDFLKKCARGTSGCPKVDRHTICWTPVSRTRAAPAREEQKAAEKISTEAKSPSTERPDLYAEHKRLQTQKRITKLKARQARKGVDLKAMPLTGKAALKAIRSKS